MATHRKWLRKSLIAAAITGVISSLGLVLVILNPHWLISDTVLDWTVRRFEQKGIYLDIDLKEKELSWAPFPKLHFFFAFDNFCISQKETRICIKDATFGGSFRVSLRGLVPDTLGPIKIKSIEGLLSMESSQTENSPTLPQLPLWLGQTTLSDIEIQSVLLQLKKNQSTQFLAGSLSCDNRSTPQKDLTTACKASIRVKSQTTRKRVEWLKGHGNFQIHKANRVEFHVEGELLDKAARRTRAAWHGSIRQGEGRGYQLESLISTNTPKLELGIGLRAQIRDPNRIETQIDAEILETPSRTKRRFESLGMTLKLCRAQLNLQRGSLVISGCQINGSAWDNLIKRNLLSPPLIVSGQLNFKPFPKGTLLAQIKEWETETLHVKANLQATFEKKPSLPLSFSSHSSSELTIAIKQFQTLVSFLRDSPFAIPAPFNAMDGKLEAGFRTLKGSTSQMDFPLFGSLSLHGQEQKLEAELSGQVTITPNNFNKTKVQLQLAISNSIFSLPSLEFGNFAGIIPDERIGQMKEPQNQLSKTSNPIKWRLEIFTKKDQSISIKSNLLKAPLPIALRFQTRSNGSARGKITIKPVRLMLFHRKANLRKFRIKIAIRQNEEPLVEVEGRIDVPYPDYDVTILIEGRAESPRIILESTPPLASRDILSLLLFGEVPDALDVEQTDSVSNTDSALAQRSISLAALYLLASTPIQSIRYDPKSKDLSVKLRAGEKTVVTLSSGSSGLEAIGLTRRIGKNWIFSTELPMGKQKTSEGISSFLEWFKQY